MIPSGQTIHSLFDLEGNRIAEYDYDAQAGTSTLIREYIWNGFVPVGVIENGVTYQIKTDHIGRPVYANIAEDPLGIKVWEATYLPFGGVDITNEPLADHPNTRFPGQWFQMESGLYQNWMRDYDPTTGRYMQADPLGLVDGASVYGYARGNPGRYVDPRGEQSVFWGKVTALAGGAAVADGPFPFGDAVGLCIVGAAILYCAAGGNYCSSAEDDDGCKEWFNELYQLYSELILLGPEHWPSFEAYNDSAESYNQTCGAPYLPLIPLSPLRR